MHSARGHPMTSLSMKIQIIWGGLGYMTHMSCYIRNTCWQQRLLSFSNPLLRLQGSAKFFLSWAQVIGFPEGDSWEYISNHVLLRFFWDKPRQVYTLKRPPWDTLSSLPFSLKIMPTERPFPRHKQYLTFWFTKWRSLKHLKAQKGPPWGSKQGHDLTGLIRIKRYLLNAKSFLGKMRSERQTVMWCFLFEGWIPDTQKPLDTGQCWSQFHTDSGDWLPQNRLEAGKGPGKWEWILRYTWKINMEYKHGGLEDGFPLQFGDF